MKIDKLRLKAYGHFRDKELDLGSDGKLHMVFGPNEAGKSTALRALSRFFFGFEHQARDGFLHQNKDLAVGATLRLPSGEILDLTRYKRRKNDLVDASNQPVDTGRMSRLLSGMNSEMFSSLFGISHDRLRAGGEDLLQAGGQLSQALFSAASGILHMRKIQEELQNQRDKLFRPRASTTSVMQKKSRLSQLNQELRQVSVHPEQWQRLNSALEEKQGQKRETISRLRELEAKRSKYSRFLKALPCMARRSELFKQWEELKSVPLLEQDFTSRRQKIRADLEHGYQERKRLNQEIQGLKRDLENITIRQDLLDLQPRIHSLQKEVALISQSREELEQIKAQEHNLNLTIREKCALLGRSFSHRELEKLGLSQKQHSQIQKLARERAVLMEQMNQARQSLRDYAKQLKNARLGLKSVPSIPRMDYLETTCRRLASAGDLEEKRRDLERQIQDLDRELETRISSLGLWTGKVEQLLSLPLPLPETVQRMEDELLQARQNQESALREVRETEKSIASYREQLNSLSREDLPQPETLHSLRTVRDQGWRLVQKAWLEKHEDPAEIRDFLDNIGGGRDLASGFEQIMHRVDETADSMLDKSKELARIQSLQEQIRAWEEKLEQARKEYQKARQEHDTTQQKWQDLWGEAGITPLSPREMRTWLSNVQEISRIYREKQSLAGDLEQTRERINNLHREGMQALEDTGYQGPGPAELSALAELLEKIRAEAREARSAQESWEHEINSAKRNLLQAGSKSRQAKRKLGKWREKWAGSLEPLGLDPANDTESVLEEIQIRQELSSTWNQLQNLRNKKSELENKLLDFQAQVDEICHELEWQRDKAQPEEMLAILGRELEQEQEKTSLKRQMEKELRQGQSNLEKLESRIQAWERELEQLCREAGTDDPEELPGVEEKSKQKEDTRKELQSQESSLQELAEGQDLETFTAEAGAFQSHELESQLQELEQEKHELERERDEITSEIATLQKDLRAMDGTSRAAEIKQEIQEIRAELEQETREYIQLTLAQTILDSEMERFRSANQGPVLNQAGEFVNRITLGSLTGIYADYDSRGDLVLRAQRPDGSGLGVSELSDGTRDQLFLALRLGGLIHYLERNQPFPFTVDDILVHFDDQRAAKTLGVLAEMTPKTQVIFFTHHSHLVDLANQTLDPDQLQIHEL